MKIEKKNGATYIEVTRRVKLTDEDIDNIVCTALEGGITYWCSSAEVVGGDYLGEYASDQISRGGSLRLYDAEEGKVYELTKSQFINGFAEACRDGYLNNAFEGDGFDTGEIDAEIADVIVQYALFGEVVYG